MLICGTFDVISACRPYFLIDAALTTAQRAGVVQTAERWSAVVQLCTNTTQWTQSVGVSVSSFTRLTALFSGAGRGYLADLLQAPLSHFLSRAAAAPHCSQRRRPARGRGGGAGAESTHSTVSFTAQSALGRRD